MVELGYQVIVDLVVGQVCFEVGFVVVEEDDFVVDSVGFVFDWVDFVDFVGQVDSSGLVEAVIVDWQNPEDLQIYLPVFVFLVEVAVVAVVAVKAVKAVVEAVVVVEAIVVEFDQAVVVFDFVVIQL